MTQDSKNAKLKQSTVFIKDDKGEYSMSDGNLEPDLFSGVKVAIFQKKPINLEEEMRRYGESDYCGIEWTNQELKIQNIVAKKVRLTACHLPTKNAIIYALPKPYVNLGVYYPEVQYVRGIPVIFNATVGNTPVKLTVTSAKKMPVNAALYSVPKTHKIILPRRH